MGFYGETWIGRLWGYCSTVNVLIFYDDVSSRSLLGCCKEEKKKKAESRSSDWIKSNGSTRFIGCLFFLQLRRPVTYFPCLDVHISSSLLFAGRLLFRKDDVIKRINASCSGLIDSILLIIILFFYCIALEPAAY